MHIGEGKHPFPFRTRALSPPPPMVVPARSGVRVGCRHIYAPAFPKGEAGAFFCQIFRGRRGLSLAAEDYETIPFFCSNGEETTHQTNCEGVNQVRLTVSRVKSSGLLPPSAKRSSFSSRPSLIAAALRPCKALRVSANRLLENSMPS